MSTKKDKVLDVIQPFMIGGVSGCLATCVVQPIDLVKVRIQLKSEVMGKGSPSSSVSPFVVMREIY